MQIVFLRWRGKREEGELDYRYKGKLYIFQNVLAGVCQQCGEKYLTAEVAEEIEKKIKISARFARDHPSGT